MSKTNFRGWRRALEAKRGELMSSQYPTENLAVERVPDSMEELSLEIERNMAVDTLNRKAVLLGRVTEALERLAGGRYGMCLVCEKPISAKRLATLPWAELCIERQQAAEDRQRRNEAGILGVGAGATA